MTRLYKSSSCKWGHMLCDTYKSRVQHMEREHRGCT